MRRLTMEDFHPFAASLLTSEGTPVLFPEDTRSVIIVDGRNRYAFTRVNNVINFVKLAGQDCGLDLFGTLVRVLAPLFQEWYGAMPPRACPHKFLLRTGMSGCRDIIIKYIEHEDSLSERTKGIIHVSMYNAVTLPYPVYIRDFVEALGFLRGFLTEEERDRPVEVFADRNGYQVDLDPEAPRGAIKLILKTGIDDDYYHVEDSGRNTIFDPFGFHNLLEKQVVEEEREDEKIILAY